MRIFITSSFSYWGNFQPKDLFEPSDRMIAGGETAMIHLSTQLARLGHEVILFYGDMATSYRGVDFLPKAEARRLIPSMRGDVLIAWEDMEAISWNHRCDLVVMPMQTNAMLMGPLDWGVDYYQAVSKWHVETLIRSDATLPISARDKFVIFPNGVDPARYQQTATRIPGRVVYSSSPDRGLHHLLRIWPQVKAAVPNASLRIFYDMSKWLAIVDEELAKGYVLNTTDRGLQVRRGLEATKDMDVVAVGAVGQWRLAQEQLSSSLLCYPCDTVDKATEGFGITVLEGMAAGIPVLTTDCDAFAELWKGSACQILLPVEGKEDQWAKTITKLLTDGSESAKWALRGSKKAATLTWDRIGEEYERWLVKALKAKQRGLSSPALDAAPAVSAAAG